MALSQTLHVAPAGPRGYASCAPLLSGHHMLITRRSGRAAEAERGTHGVGGGVPGATRPLLHDIVLAVPCYATLCHMICCAALCCLTCRPPGWTVRRWQVLI